MLKSKPAPRNEINLFSHANQVQEPVRMPVVRVNKINSFSPKIINKSYTKINDFNTINKQKKREESSLSLSRYKKNCERNKAKCNEKKKKT